MPSYETLCVLHPELSDSRVKEIVAWMQKILDNGQSTDVQVDDWGMRELASLTKKQSRGYYVRMEYDAPPPALKELERNLRLSEDVLRFLSVLRDARTVMPAPLRPVAAPTPPQPPAPAEASGGASEPTAPAESEAPTATESAQTAEVENQEG
jgi:small subunit ribosomal protein S6